MRHLAAPPAPAGGRPPRRRAARMPHPGRLRGFAWHDRCSLPEGVSSLSFSRVSSLAALRTAEADTGQAGRNLERVRGLYDIHAVPKKDLSQAESDLIKSQSGLERAKARLTILGLDAKQHTSRFTLRAPLAGTVVE